MEGIQVEDIFELVSFVISGKFKILTHEEDTLSCLENIRPIFCL